MYVSSDGGFDPDDGLTAPRLDALVAAFEMGYVGVPRPISTADLGAVLGSSGQAVSGRVRRGVEALVRNVLGVPDQQR